MDELIELVAQPPRGAAGIKDASAMSPLEYEHYCAALLSEGGWSTRVTPEGGDQGVDIVAKKNDKTLVVQVKRYEGSVGNAAVQQVVAGRMHLKADYAVVVSPAPFTKSARELAATTGVLLVHHDQLAALDLLP